MAVDMSNQMITNIRKRVLQEYKDAGYEVSDSGIIHDPYNFKNEKVESHPLEQSKYSQWLQLFKDTLWHFLTGQTR